MENYETQGYSLFGEQPYLFDASNLEQQVYMIGNNMNTRKTYTTSPITTGLQSEPISFDDYKPQEILPLDIKNIVLPPPNYQCYVEPPVAKGTVTYFKHQEPTITRTITLNFNTTKTVVRENIIHHQHVQTVITNVNRNHWHTQRVVVKDNNFHHYLINNVVKINDIHHQKLEHVRGEGKIMKDYKQTQQVIAPSCEFSDKGGNPVSQSLPLTPIQDLASSTSQPTLTS